MGMRMRARVFCYLYMHAWTYTHGCTDNKHSRLDEIGPACMRALGSYSECIYVYINSDKGFGWISLFQQQNTSCILKHVFLFYLPYRSVEWIDFCKNVFDCVDGMWYTYCVIHLRSLVSDEQDRVKIAILNKKLFETMRSIKKYILLYEIYRKLLFAKIDPL